MAIVKGSEIVEVGFLESAKKEVKEFSELLTDLKKLASEKTEGVGVANPKSIKEIKEYNENVSGALKLMDEIAKLEKKEVQLKAKLTAAQTKQNKEVLKYREEIKDTNKEIRNQIKIEKALGVELNDLTNVYEELKDVQIEQVNNIKEAKEQNAGLRKVVELLNPAIEEEAELIERLNASIDSNSEFIKGNSDALVQRKINIGNYKEDVREALAETARFSDETGVLSVVLGKLEGIYAGVTNRIAKYEAAQQAAGKTTGRTGKILKGFGSVVATVAAVAIAGYAAALGTSREAQIKLQVQLAQLQFKFAEFAGRVGKAAIVVGKIFMQVGEDVGGFFETTQTKITEFFTVLSNPLEAARKSVSNFGNDTKDSNEKVKASYSELFEEVGDAFEGFTLTLDNELSEAIEKQVRRQFQIQDAINKTVVSVARLTNEEEKFSQLADDATSSLAEQARQTVNYNAALVKRVNTELKLLRLQEDSAQAAVDLRRATGLAADPAQQSALAQATAARIEKEGELGRLIIENSRRASEIVRDAAIQQKDILQDGLETFLAINKQIADDTSRTFGERQEALNKNNKAFIELSEQIENTFNGSVKALENVTGLTEDQREILKQNLDLDKLINEFRENGSLEILDQITALEGGEQITTEILDSVRTLSEIYSDNLETQRNFNKELADSKVLQVQIERLEARRTELAKIRQQIGSEGFDLGEALKELDEAETVQSLTDDIERLNAEIEKLSPNSAERQEKELERLEKQIELDTIEIAQAQETADALKEINDKAAEDKANSDKEDENARRERLRQIREDARAVSDLLKEQSKERQEAFQEEIQDRQNRTDQLRELAAQGNQDALDALAFEEKKIAEAERKAQVEQQRQKAIEASLAAFKTYTAALEDGEKPTQALGTTLRNLTVISQFINSLPTFFDGTDRTNPNGENVDGKGGFHAILHPNEMIFNAKQTKNDLGDRNRNEVIDIVKRYDSGTLAPKQQDFQSEAFKQIVNANQKMVKFVQEVAKKPTLTATDTDNVRKIAKDVFKGMSGTREIRKRVNRW